MRDRVTECDRGFGNSHTRGYSKGKLCNIPVNSVIPSKYGGLLGHAVTELRATRYLAGGWA